MSTLTCTVEIDLPERPTLSHGWPKHYAALLADVARLLEHHRIVQSTFAALRPATNLGYGYHREQAALTDFILGPQISPDLLDLVRTAGQDNPTAIVPGAHDRALLTGEGATTA